MQLIATCAFGLEKIVYQELKKLGLWVVETEDGRVTFEGDVEAMLKANLWLRCADRVQIKVGAGEARTFDELFALVSALPWEQYIGKDDVFPVDVTSVRSQLYALSAIQSIVKKAVVQRLQQAYGDERLSESSGVVYHIHARAHKDHFILTIDTSGDGLNKRGYRLRTNAAPLKETLAAALVQLSDWTYDKPLRDPFCGSGTILIEAAMLATNTAPGLKRSFACEKWSWVDHELVDRVKKEARQAYIHRDLDISGIDLDGDVIKVARDNATRAGFHTISFEEGDVRQVDLSFFQGATVVTNPPYGERLEDTQRVQRLYRELGQRFQNLHGTSLFLLTSETQFPELFGRRADKNRKLFNGKIMCYLYSFLRGA